MRNTKLVEWILRIAVAGEFLGHGMFALGIKTGWISYFEALGFTPEFATAWLPIIGIMDIIVVLFVIFKPVRIILLWAVIWATWTAVLRPLTGDPIWDLVERFANIGAPLALLAMYGFSNWWKAGRVN